MTLSRLRRAALAAAIAVAVSLLAQSPATMQTIEFEVASVKLPMPGAQPFFGIRPGGRFSASSMSLLLLIELAHQINHDFQIVGGPDWVRTARYAIDARAPAGITMGPLVSKPGTPRSPAQQMLAALLADRFRLMVHHETRSTPGYALVMARADQRPGPGLRPSPPQIDCEALRLAHQLPKRPTAPPPPGQGPPCLTLFYPGRIVFGTTPVEGLVTFLMNQMNRTVVDRTAFAADRSAPSGSSAPPTAPSLVTALQEQLGLRLTAATVPTDTLVIDSISQPMPD